MHHREHVDARIGPTQGPVSGAARDAVFRIRIWYAESSIMKCCFWPCRLRRMKIIMAKIARASAARAMIRRDDENAIADS